MRVQSASGSRAKTWLIDEGHELSHADPCILREVVDCRVDDAGCVQGCPVVELDEQSGMLKSGANLTHRRTVSKSVAMAGAQQPSVQIVRRGADEGGASRFYPCFTNVDGLREWLQMLLTPLALAG